MAKDIIIFDEYYNLNAIEMFRNYFYDIPTALAAFSNVITTDPYS